MHTCDYLSEENLVCFTIKESNINTSKNMENRNGNVKQTEFFSDGNLKILRMHDKK